jgi:hypothetical protein
LQAFPPVLGELLCIAAVLEPQHEVVILERLWAKKK